MIIPHFHSKPPSSSTAMIRILVCLVLLVPFPLAAQTAEAEVEATVHSLFDAMRSADGATAAAIFRSDARLQSVTEQPDGTSMVMTSEIAAFVQAVGTPRTELWDERIWNLEIRVDGDLATAWMNYAFYVDDQLSHCGVNAFQFARNDAGWKVLQITDTRRRVGCSPPV